MGEYLVLSLGNEAWAALDTVSAFSVRLGRSSEADLTVPESVPEALRGTVSRLHARLIHHDGGFWIEDLDSQNFTLCDGKIVFGASRFTPPCAVTLGGLPVHLELRSLDEDSLPGLTMGGDGPARREPEPAGYDTTIRHAHDWGKVRNYLRLFSAMHQIMEALSSARRAADLSRVLVEHFARYVGATHVRVVLGARWEACESILAAEGARADAARLHGIDLAQRRCAQECCRLPLNRPSVCWVVAPAGRETAEVAVVVAEFKDAVPDLDTAGADPLIGLTVRVAQSLSHALSDLESHRASVLESVARVPSGAMLEACQKEEIWGESASFTRSLYHAELAATRYLSVVHRNNRLGVVFILGETGTGKSALARAMHRLSDHKNEPFCELNCAAIPVPLAESELFGYEKGAHDKAFANRAGWFEVAGNGMLFLDEIGKTSTDFQSKLLKVLDTGEFIRLGSSVTRKTNCHVVLATSEDPAKLCETGRLLQEFWFRAGAFTITLAPLRDRPEDIVLLTMKKLDTINAARPGEMPKRVSPRVLALFKAYPWPGNIRELLQSVEVAYAMCPAEDAEIRVEHLPESFLRGLGLRETELPARTEPDALRKNWDSHIAAAERAYLVGMIAACGGNLSEVARRAAKSYQTVHNKLRDLRMWLNSTLEEEAQRERDMLQELAGEHWAMICRMER